MFSLYLLIIIDIIALVLAQLALKKGMLILGPIDFSLANFWNLFLTVFKNFYLLSGLFLMGVNFMLWLFILSRVNLNIIYPISNSLSLTLAVVGSYFLFKESLHPVQIIGIVAIVIGIFLVLKPFNN